MMDGSIDVDIIMKTLGLDDAYFRQTDIIKQINDPFCGVWTTVYQAYESLYSAPAVFSCLADPKLEKILLEGTDWLCHADSFNPGFYSNNDVHYESGRGEGFDFLVKEIYFHSLEAGQLHINQDFIFLFGLFRGDDGCYYAIDKCGRKEMVVDVGEDAVRFRTSYLMRYTAARQMLYVQFIDSRRSSASTYLTSACLIDSEERRGNDYRYKIWYQSTSAHDYLFSMIYARSIVRPKDVSECGIWPYDDGCDEVFPEFIIEELPDGSYKRFSCDPAGLGDYFGGNPDAPHYLTPVYFSPEVLDRYRADPHFKVSERRLSCGTQWGVEIDNAIPGRVMVYLGDLGRDLPSTEREHFRTCEISPTGQRISETAVAQDFFGSFDAPMGPVDAFLCARRKLSDTWAENFGAQLYRPYHADEDDMEKLIRIPSSNGRQEFDSVVLNLTKCCIDYLNESILAPADKAGGINRLEATLNNLGINVSLDPLRDLQDVRSACMAHAKGKKYEKLKGALLTGDNPSDIRKIIDRLTDMMNALSSAICDASAEADSISRLS